MKIWKDIDLSFEQKRDGDINDFVQIDALKSSLRNIMITLQGDRRMLMAFANNLPYLLFQPMDEITARQIGEVMLNVIERWESRIIIENLHVNPKYDQNLYEITLTFSIRNSEERHTLKQILMRT